MREAAGLKVSPHSLLLLVCLLALLLGGGSLPGQEKAPAAPPATTPESGYLGEEACKACHEDLPTKGFYKSFEDSRHWVTTMDTKKGPEFHGCEACHGPGAEHVAGGGDKTKIFTFKDASARDISNRCLKCHQYGQEHANFSRSAHVQNNVSCVDCHSPHHPKETQYLLREKQPQLCYGCHTEIKQQFSRTFHHRVNEGLVNCTDCHSPHGGTLSRSLRATASQDTVCFKCHSDKAGPFVYEHPAVKIEGCVSCHIPHGSSNPRLLKRSQINLLCLECHSLTVDSNIATVPSFHNQSSKYQACTMCHAFIHGSNTSNVYFKP